MEWREHWIPEPLLEFKTGYLFKSGVKLALDNKLIHIFKKKTAYKKALKVT